ncbi:Sulfite exporter TauE/SafE family protein 3 [Linum grandiflorum]
MMVVHIHEYVKNALLLGVAGTLWLASSPFVSAYNQEEEALLAHRSLGSEYHHVWPEMGFGWRLVGASMIGFLGAAFGSVGGVGGGGIFVPMLTLIIGFDPKSATAISKCMITGAAVATVVYNLKLRHPSLDLPIVEYDLVLLIQPVLLLGISIGVTFNVIFPDWMVTILLITLLLATAIRAFFKGLEIWNKESSSKYLKPTAGNGDGGDLEYKPLLGGPSPPKKREVTVIENIRWKELGLVTFVWLAYLALQISKNYTATCSTEYWVLNLVQIPVSGSVFLYQAIGLYKGTKKIASKGEGAMNLKLKQLALFSISGLFAGIVGGMLGLGGGFVMGPLFLELGIPPEVTSATAALGMAFSASMSVVEYYLLHRFPVPYAMYLVGVSIVAAYIGQYLISVVVRWSGRASLIIFVLSFTIFVSAISLGGIGITNLVQKIHKGEYMGFENLCHYQP